MLKSRTEYLLFLLIIFVAGYFHNVNLANQNARLDSIYSVVEKDHNLPLFSIDKYIFDAKNGGNTIDWSYYNGHYYSNKAPGSLLIGIPAYFLIYHIENLFQIDQTNPIIEFLNTYLLNLFLSIIPLAIACVFFFRILLSQSVKTRNALTISISLVLCTALLPFNTHIWGNTISTSFSVIALYYLLKSDKRSLLLSGFFLALTASIEYLTIIVSIILFLYAVYKYRKSAIWLIVGALPIVLLTMCYHYICFDSPFTLSTTYSNPVFADNTLFLNMFGFPKLEVLYELTLGVRRGIFVSMPILLISIYSFIMWFWSKKNLSLAVVSISIISIFLLLNSSFNGWHGGSTILSRYLFPTIPFFFLSFIYTFPVKKFFGKVLTSVLAIVSFSNMLVVSSICTSAEDNHPNPLFGNYYGMFLEGSLSPFGFPIRLQALDNNWKLYHEYSSSNFGLILGLNGLYSLLPLILISSIVAYFLFKSAKN